MENENIIDLTCRGCGGTMQHDKREGAKVTKLENGGLMFTQNDEPHTFTCPNCGKAFATWNPGPKTLAAIGGGSVGIHIGGSSIGNNIIIGNGNRIND